MMWKHLAAAMAVTLAVQSPAPPPGATLTLVQRAIAPLFFSNPLVKRSGTIRPLPGHRLDLVVITLGDAPIEADIRQFALISTDGVTYEPIAAGASPDQIFPIDSLELGREMGQILPSDAEVLMKRISTTSVMLEADARATLAFLFQLPERSATRAFRLPDGSELALAR
jgi:hypothetical protein